MTQLGTQIDATREETLRDALHAAVVVGLHEHVPGAIGLVTKGTPVCAMAGFAHFVLGVSVPGTTVGAIVTAAGLQGTTALYAWRRASARDASAS